MRRLLIFGILGILFLSNCTTLKRARRLYPCPDPIASRDSIYIERIREVPVLVPGDTIRTEVQTNCPDQEIVVQETNRLKQTIRILNGKLIASASVKPDSIKVPIKEIEIRYQETKVPDPVKYIPRFYKFALYWTLGSWILLILVIYWKIKK